MACFVYHTKSCPSGKLTLALAHGKRSSSSTIVQLAVVAMLIGFVFAAIGRRNRSPSCNSFLGFPFQAKVQEACFLV
eukprot:8431054-Ditylum_brightwellii.AAC.1